jgi:predicted dehydrogenase
MKTPIRMVIVGAGDRAMIYARESLAHPELFQVVGVADVSQERVRRAQETFSIPQEHCFSSAEELAAYPRFADAVINGTMDRQHVSTSLPLLRSGYDMLLEKPFAVNQEEAQELLHCVQETGRRVMVCHVLRYSPFYRKIQEIIASGEIGKIINIQMAEQVSFFHESVSYVRGKYALPEICGSGMLLSKCSHDLDIMAWLMNDTRPSRVSSIGSVFQFRPEMAPEGAGTHCLLNCPVERDCIYSARRLYLEHPQRWANNVWRECGHAGCSEEEKQRILLEKDNPYSRCVYRCDLQIVDHQSVLVGFADGATGTFSMTGGAAAPARHIHITGTRGEISGIFEEKRFTVSRIDPEAEGGMVRRVVDAPVALSWDAHGGGDQAVVQDFIALLTGTGVSPCCTTLEDSMAGHQIVFLAEKSREKNGETQYL